VETPRPDGSTARIVYRTGGPIDAAALEVLSEKVGWPPRPLKKVEAALRNSYLVASLHLQVWRHGVGARGRACRLVAAERLGEEFGRVRDLGEMGVWTLCAASPARRTRWRRINACP
jgi:hypothetical protein